MAPPEQVPTPVKRLDREDVKLLALKLAEDSLARGDTEMALGAAKVYATLRWGFVRANAGGEP